MLLLDPHNMLFSITIRLGLVGFVLFLYVLFVFGKMCVKSIKEGKDHFIKSWGRCVASAFVGFFILGIFERSFSHLQETVFFYDIINDNYFVAIKSRIDMILENIELLRQRD